MDERIIYTYLTGNATEQEKQALLNWLNESEDNRMQFCEMKALWQARRISGHKQQDKKFEISLQRLNDQIDHITSQQEKHSVQLILRWTLGVAAAILLAVGLTYSWWTGEEDPNREQKEWIVYTNVDADQNIKTLLLPDSSKVWLSSKARLSCPLHFTGDKRVVRLDGMAFFEIKKDKKHPFLVETPTCHIEVLGTSFSINTNASEGVAETILMEGYVQLTDPAGKSLTTLRPGQQALYSAEHKRLDVHEVDANSLTAWRFGLITMTDKSIQEIVARLEEIYHIKIEMNTESVEGRRYNFSFKRSKGAEMALSQLSFITGVPARMASEK